MGRIRSGLGTSSARSAAAAVKEAVDTARAALGRVAPRLAFLTCSVEKRPADVLQACRESLPGVPIHGITTSLGILGAEGVIAGADGAVGVLLLAGGPEVAFAAGSAVVGDDPRVAGRAAAAAARSGLGGEPARVILFNASPGAEEEILAGVGDVFRGVPVYGGSAADNTITGKWAVFTSAGAVGNGVSLAVIGGDVKVGGAFVAPYTDTGHTVDITAAEGRTIRELDGRPAATVLDEALGGVLRHEVAEGGNILTQMATSPIAIRKTSTHALTIHPARINKADGSVDVFARVSGGDRLSLMKASEDEIVGGLAPLIAAALDRLGARPAAGVLIFCAGCAGAVGARLDRGLRAHLGAKLAGVPVLGLCTFGEQGHVPAIGNVHQNLTLGLVLLA